MNEKQEIRAKALEISVMIYGPLTEQTSHFMRDSSDLPPYYLDLADAIMSWIEKGDSCPVISEQ